MFELKDKKMKTESPVPEHITRISEFIIQNPKPFFLFVIVNIFYYKEHLEATPCSSRDGHICRFLLCKCSNYFA